MPKTSRSDQMDFKGLQIIADEFTGIISNTNLTAVTTMAASTVATDFATQKVQLDLVITKLNALITALKT